MGWRTLRLGEEGHRPGTEVAGALLHRGDGRLVEARSFHLESPVEDAGVLEQAEDDGRRGCSRPDPLDGGGHGEIVGDPGQTFADRTAAHHGDIDQERHGPGGGWIFQMGGRLLDLDDEPGKLDDEPGSLRDRLARDGPGVRHHPLRRLQAPQRSVDFDLEQRGLGDTAGARVADRHLRAADVVGQKLPAVRLNPNHHGRGRRHGISFECGEAGVYRRTEARADERALCFEGEFEGKKG